MTLMAGFDQIVELTPSFILNLLQSSVQILDARAGRATPLVPPFVYQANITTGGESLNLRLVIVEDPIPLLSSNAVGRPVLQLRLNFVDSSVTGLAGGSSVAVSGLSGAVTISGLVVINTAPPLPVAPVSPRPFAPPPPTPPAGSQVQAAVFIFNTANIGTSFDPASVSELDRTFDEIPSYSFSTFSASVNTDVQNDLQARLSFSLLGATPRDTRIQLGSSLVVFPPSPGVLPDPGAFQVASLTVATILDDTGAGVALGLFSNVLPTSSGNVNNRTTAEGTVVTTGQGIGLSMSEAVFRQAVFCRELPGRLGFPVLTPPPMPPVCGTAGGVAIPGQSGQLTRIDVNFIAPDSVVVSGSVADSGFCFQVNGSFSIAFQLGINAAGTGLTSTSGVPAVDINFDVEWYCYIAAGVLLGLIGITITFIVEVIVDGIVEGAVASGLAGIAPAGLPIPGTIPFVTFSAVNVTPTGLSAIANFNPPVTAARPRALVLSAPELRSEVAVEEVDSVFVNSFPPECAGEYATTLVRNTQTWRLNVDEETAVGRPLRWFLAGRELTDTSGVQTLSNVQRIIDDDTIIGPVRISYIVGRNFLDLTNDPDDGDFTVNVRIRGSETRDGFGPSTTRSIEFRGLAFLRPELYTCLLDWVESRRMHGRPGSGGGADDDSVLPINVRDWLKGFDREVRPEFLAELIRPAIRSGQPGLMEFLTTLAPALGSTLHRALELSQSVGSDGQDQQRPVLELDDPDLT